MDLDKGRSLSLWHCVALALPALVFCVLSTFLAHWAEATVAFNRLHLIVFGVAPILVAFLALTRDAGQAPPISGDLTGGSSHDEVELSEALEEPLPEESDETERLLAIQASGSAAESASCEVVISEASDEIYLPEEATAPTIAEPVPSLPQRFNSWEDVVDDSPKEDGMPQVPLLKPGLPFSSFPVFVHIYDVSNSEGIQNINGFLAHRLSPLKFGGLFHAGVEIDGQEWSFGFTTFGTGVHPCVPKMHPLHHYRETIALDNTVLTPQQIRDLIQAISMEYLGTSYHLVRRNCCHFASDLCHRLGAGCLPDWVDRLAKIGDSMLTVSQGLEKTFCDVHLSRSVVPDDSRQGMWCDNLISRSAMVHI